MIGGMDRDPIRDDRHRTAREMIRDILSDPTGCACVACVAIVVLAPAPAYALYALLFCLVMTE